MARQQDGVKAKLQTQLYGTHCLPNSTKHIAFTRD